MLFETSTQVI